MIGNNKINTYEISSVFIYNDIQILHKMFERLYVMFKNNK